jgi:hypothetical protein
MSGGAPRLRRRPKIAEGRDMSDHDRRLIAYELHQSLDMPLSTAQVDRAWMDAAHQRAPYRCLPLAIANQAGWLIPSPASFSAYWDGGPFKENVQIVFDPPLNTGAAPDSLAFMLVSITTLNPEVYSDPRVTSHFGSGVVTFSIPYLFRTPRGINLWVKGPVNYIKDGVQPLEGIVETDWLPATFTMNWKFTRPNYQVRFERGEPICMIVPVPRGVGEKLEPVYLPLDSNPELAKEYREWEKSRSQFNTDLSTLNPDAVKRGWQRDYMKGKTVSGGRAEEHQTKIDLREFTRAEEKPAEGKGERPA